MAVIAPSGPVLDRSVLQRGIAVLEGWGLEVVCGAAVHQVRGYLAGDDRARAADLLWALGDPSCRAVWCARGGYGADRTIAALDPAEVDALAGGAPKVFVGFSDITGLHALLSKRLGWVSFYGPGVSKLGTANDWTLAGVRSLLFDARPLTVGPHPDDGWVTTLVPGQADGELVGGCLPRLARLVGTPLQVDLADRLCFFEDVNESVMSVDENLTQLLAAGCFDGCRGIAIGEHVRVTPRDGPTNLGLEQVFADLLVPLGIPTCHYLPFSHGTHQATLPIGVAAHLDADHGVLSVPGPVVR